MAAYSEKFICRSITAEAQSLVAPGRKRKRTRPRVSSSCDGLTFDVADWSDYEGYVPGMMPILQKYHPEILVADYACKALEGESRGVNVVIKFESEEALMAFYNDP